MQRATKRKIKELPKIKRKERKVFELNISSDHLVEVIQQSPERRLWAYVLNRVIRDIQEGKGYIRGEAIEWVKADSEEEGGFAWIIHTLGFDGFKDKVVDYLIGGGDTPALLRMFHSLDDDNT